MPRLPRLALVGRELNGAAYAASLGYMAMLGLALVLVLRPQGTYFALQLTGGPNLVIAVLLVILAAAPAMLLPPSLASPTSFCVAVFFYLVLLPSSLLGLLVGVRSFWYFAMLIVVSLVMIEAAWRHDQTLEPRRPSQAMSEHRTATIVLFGVTLAFIIYMLFVYPGDLRLVSFSDVYALRAEAKAHRDAIYGYGTGIFSGAVGPLALVYGLAYRKRALTAASVVGYVLIYMAAGNKSSLVVVPLVVAVFYFFRRRRDAIVIPLTLSIVMGGCGLIDTIARTPVLSALVVDRMIVAPGTLNGLYFQYFSDHDFVRWQHGFLSFTATSPVESPSQTIGTRYFAAGNNANANFVADGFANLGFAGVAILLVVFLGIVFVLDRLTRRMPLHAALAVITPLMISITNMSTLTTLLTGGAASLMALLFGMSLLDGSSRLNHG